MRTFQENFDLSHRQLLETLTAYATVEAEPHLSNLCARLDFNGYYSSYCAQSFVLSCHCRALAVHVVACGTQIPARRLHRRMLPEPIQSSAGEK